MLSCILSVSSADKHSSRASIPTLMVVLYAAWVRRSKVIIDWHNFGYTILALTMGKTHPVVTVR